MKKRGWTMAEMAVAFIVLMILSLVGINMIKPNNSQARIFVYATIRNLTRANAYLIEKYGDIASAEATLSGTGAYCLLLADMFSLSESPNCTSGDGVVNIKFSNGVTIQGLASDWIVPYTNADFSVKNIVVDVDGNSGMNKVGIDRFPLRLLKDGMFDGTVQAVNCNSEQLCHPETGACTTVSHTYCKNGFTPSGTATTNNFITDNDIIAYDVYRPIEETEISRAMVIATSLSTAQADCGAYGGGGYLTKKQCGALGYKLYDQCAQTDACENCSGTMGGSTYDVCPPGGNTPANCASLAATNNPLDFGCFTHIRKPTAGLGMLTGALLNEIDM